jgi:thymidylate synthase
MKVKLVLLLIAAVASTALVASAQQQNQPTAYVVNPVRQPGQPQTTNSSSNTAFVPRQVVVGTPAGLQTARVFGPDQAYYVANFTPEENNLSAQAEALAHQLAEAGSDGDRDKIKDQLTEVLTKQFDQRQKRHQEEIKQLESQIKKLQDLVDKRQENRREIIGARLNQIVKESQGLGW